MSSDFNYPDKKGGVWPILAAIFLVTTLALGVLYFLEMRATKKLQADYKTLSNQSSGESSSEEKAAPAKTATETEPTTDDTKSIATLNAQIKTLTSEKTAAEKAKTDAETAKTAAEAAKTTAENNLAIANSNKAIAQKYNDLLAYFTDVVDAHNGLAGITNAEYNAAKDLAEATGDATLIDKLDYVWDQVAVPQIDRIVTLIDYIQTKIEQKLQ